MSADTTKAVDDLVVAYGYQREGARKRSLMYSLRYTEVYTAPLHAKCHTQGYVYASHRRLPPQQTAVPFKAADSSNVNTHLQHGNLHGVGGVVREENKQPMATSIQKRCST